MVPVTNLFQRLAWKGVERQHQAIDPANRYGGLPVEQHDVYKERSPLYNVDKLQIPLYVGVTRNDEDVNIEEDMQLVDALRSRKPVLATTMVYDNPPGGHTFDRRVDPKTLRAGKHARAARLLESRVDVPRLESGSVPRLDDHYAKMTELTAVV